MRGWAGPALHGTEGRGRRVETRSGRRVEKRSARRLLPRPPRGPAALSSLPPALDAPSDPLCVCRRPLEGGARAGAHPRARVRPGAHAHVQPERPCPRHPSRACKSRRLRGAGSRMRLGPLRHCCLGDSGGRGGGRSLGDPVGGGADIASFHTLPLHAGAQISREAS